jgi:hypothetical protein
MARYTTKSGTGYYTQGSYVFNARTDKQVCSLMRTSGPTLMVPRDCSDEQLARIIRREQQRAREAYDAEMGL